MPHESLETRLRRIAWNLYPVFFGTGGRVVFLGHDWRDIIVEVPLTLRTRNYVGTIYGGSMYGAIDPVYMIMLMENLGPDFLVWDKAATIRFRRPGKKTLTATFRLDENELRAIRAQLAKKPSIERVYRVELVDADGVVCAEIDKTLWIGRKDARATKPSRKKRATRGRGSRGSRSPSTRL